MAHAETMSPSSESDEARAGRILLDILSFADAGLWRDPDPLARPFAEIPAR